MIATKAYNILRDFGLCATQADFSREWLGASDRYFSFLLAKQREPHMTALMGLAARLERLADRLAADPRFSAYTGTIDSLVDDTWDHMRARALAALPQRRIGAGSIVTTSI
ncbi:hypothetical protein M5E06_24455 [Azospirillum sp. A1-3]|uniref:DUF6626 family protein n=1 Tax=Azospirillum sp. A1-3 TaxID=185874 RepID=UPI00207703EB|nr:DUF6626 family protein [Azospirillum sp. A1-3]MCM8737276.1 hypothetical protein [Azospirillum sp. A1-3]